MISHFINDFNDDDMGGRLRLIGTAHSLRHPPRRLLPINAYTYVITSIHDGEALVVCII